MQGIRISSKAVSLGALAAAALLTASSAYAVPEGNGTNQGKGFETCAAPSTSTMQGWWTNTPWSWVGVYVGGSARACSQPNLTSSWFNTTYAQGWRYQLIWVGPQAPCTTFASRISSDTTTAYNQGKNEAISAWNALNALGFGNATNTPVVYDMESFSNDASCRAAVKSFMQGWVDQLAVAPAQVAGMYGSACGSYVQDQASLARPPFFVWPAAWDNDPSVYHVSCVSTSSWTNHQRFKQYQGGHNETWGGVTLNIDTDCGDGPTAAGGYLYANSSCIVH